MDISKSLDGEDKEADLVKKNPSGKLVCVRTFGNSDWAFNESEPEIEAVTFGVIDCGLSVTTLYVTGLTTVPTWPNTRAD